MNLPHNHEPQPAGATARFRTVVSLDLAGHGSEPPDGVCEARGCSGLAKFALRGIPLCGFHFHNAEYRWRLGHDRDLSLKQPAQSQQVSHLDPVATSKVIQPVDGATAADLDRLVDDGAWSIPVTSWTAS